MDIEREYRWRYLKSLTPMDVTAQLQDISDCFHRLGARADFESFPETAIYLDTNNRTLASKHAQYAIRMNDHPDIMTSGVVLKWRASPTDDTDRFESFQLAPREQLSELALEPNRTLADALRRLLGNVPLDDLRAIGYLQQERHKSVVHRSGEKIGVSLDLCTWTSQDPVIQRTVRRSFLEAEHIGEVGSNTSALLSETVTHFDQMGDIVREGRPKLWVFEGSTREL